MCPRTTKVARKKRLRSAHVPCQIVINGAQGARYSGRAPSFGCARGVALHCAFRCITALKKPRGARAEISVHGSWLFCRSRE